MAYHVFFTFPPADQPTSFAPSNTTTMRRTLRTLPHTCPVHPAVMIALTTALVGCSSPSPSDTSEVNDIHVSAQDTIQDQQLALLAENRYVGPTELTCIRDHFTAAIHHAQPTGHLPIGMRNPPLLVGVGELRNMVQSQGCNGTGPEQVAVLVHVGSTAAGEFDAMVQLVCLGHDPATGNYTYAQQEAGYLLDGSGALVPDQQAYSKWFSQDGPGRRYQEEVMIRRGASGGWTGYDPANDVRSLAYPWNGTISPLILDNKLSDTAMLEIVPMAELFAKDELGTGHPNKDTYLQGLAWIPVGITLSDNISTSANFSRKAADLGSPCPLTCPEVPFSFPLKGKQGC